MSKKVGKKAVAKKAPVKKVKKKAAKHIRKGKLPEQEKAEKSSFMHAEHLGNGLWAVEVENMNIKQMMALTVELIKQIQSRLE